MDSRFSDECKSRFFYMKMRTVGGLMIRECALSYRELMNYKWIMTISKGKDIRKLEIRFKKNNFFHLAGLHKLDDFKHLQKTNRNRTFERIINDDDFHNSLKDSVHFKGISNRLNILLDLNNIVLSKTKIYSIPFNANINTSIKSDYLVQFKNYKRTSYISILNGDSGYNLNSILYHDQRKLAGESASFKINRNQLLPI